MAKARFILKSGILCDYELFMHPTDPIRRFLGVTLEALPDGRTKFTPTGQPFEVEMRPEYALHVRSGDIEPADAKSAALCGVAFEPKAAAKPDGKTTEQASAPAGKKE